MGKIYFYYGSMQSGKSTNLIQAEYNYRSRGLKTLTFKPLFDTRDSDTPQVVSRLGNRLDAIGLGNSLPESIDTLLANLTPDLNVVLIDEVQFLDVMVLQNIVHYCLDHGIPLMCYGLRNSFDGKGFPASDWLLRNADKLVEMKSICWCSRKATHNAMVIDGVFHTTAPEGNMVLGDEIYIPLCYNHFRKQQLK